MKRPQFSLRLMLLVVTLCATIFAWKHAVETRKRAEQRKKIAALHEELRVLQEVRADNLFEAQGRHLNQSFHIDWDKVSFPIDVRISAVQQELKSLKPD